MGLKMELVEEMALGTGWGEGDGRCMLHNR